MKNLETKAIAREKYGIWDYKILFTLNVFMLDNIVKDESNAWQCTQLKLFFWNT